MSTEQPPINWAVILAAAAAVDGFVPGDDPAAIQQFVHDLESGKRVRLVGAGCHKCRANTVMGYDDVVDPDDGTTVRIMRVTYEHDSWCAFNRERQYRYQQRTDTRRRKGGRR